MDRPCRVFTPAEHIGRRDRTIADALDLCCSSAVEIELLFDALGANGAPASAGPSRPLAGSAGAP